ncbi:MAG: FHA domain-containing protein [Chloroflexi bacterium]|nr:FHA domain-containing protein [Chloroflexota bacterium]
MRGVWEARQPGEHGSIDPRNIGFHRYAHERLALAISFVALLAGTIGAYFISPQATALIVGAILLQGFVVMFQVKALVGRAAEVSSTQFARLHDVARRAAERFQLPPTRLFVVQDPIPRSVAFGLKAPFGIMLTSALVEGLDEEELLVAIAHEMGHIKLGHTRVGPLSGGADAQLGIPLVQVAIRAPFLWWLRCSELSADRAAYVVSERVSRVISTLVKLAVGPALYREVRPDELARQAREFYRGPVAIVSQLQSPQPFLIPRIQQIVDFAGPPEPDHGLILTQADAFTTALGMPPTTARARIAPAPTGSTKAMPTTTNPSPGRGADDRTAIFSPLSRPEAPRPTWSEDTMYVEGLGQPSPPARQGDGPTPPRPAPLEGDSAGTRLIDLSQLRHEPPVKQAWLEIQLPGGQQARYDIQAPRVTVGRGPENDVVLADPKVSTRHLTIQQSEGAFSLLDLGSRNGTQVNGSPVTRASLSSGDLVLLGDSRLVFRRA